MSATVKPRTFTMLPDELFDLVADGKISKNAAWLYAALLRHHNRKRRDDDVWPSRTSLARACGLKKPESVDGYMDELKALGLVVVSERRIAGMKASNRYTLTLIAEGNPGPADLNVSAGQPDTPKRGQRYPQMGSHATPEPGYELDEGELHQGEQDQRGKEPNRSPSGRFAPSGAGGENSQPDQHINPRRPAAQETGSWWLNDRDTFQAVMGERIKLEGVKEWNRGTFDADLVYTALRGRKTNQIDRPGSYVQSLVEKHGDALENWMLGEGFSFVDEPSG